MEHFYEHHVLHSLSIAKFFSFPENYQIMDLGSGGGFPGIPLAIYFPQVNFHMVDSIRKKLLVAESVAATIGLTNITTQHTRAEEIKDRKFDTVISRAVAPLKTLWSWTYPLLKKKANETQQNPHGLICLKGGELENEIAESGKKPQVWDIHTILKEEFFKEKYILYVKD